MTTSKEPMMPQETNETVVAGAPLTLGKLEPGDGVSYWRASVRFTHRDGDPRAQVVDVFGQVHAEGTSHRSGVVRLALAASSEVLELPARCWFGVEGHELHVRAATVGETLSVCLERFGRMPPAPDCEWYEIGKTLADAACRNAVAVPVMNTAPSGVVA